MEEEEETLRVVSMDSNSVPTTSGSMFAEPGSDMVKIKVYQSQKDLINDKIEKQCIDQQKH